MKLSHFISKTTPYFDIKYENLHIKISIKINLTKKKPLFEYKNYKNLHIII